jgi:phospholipid/cholesterol/gamma-HCH transport system substrate-binding protein
MIKEEDPRFRHLERKIGLFLLAAVAGLALVVALVGIQRGLFTKTYTLHFTADRGTGFSKGMPVKLSGFRIGKITDLALNEHAMVDITIEVDRKYAKWIRSDSIAKQVKEGLVGDGIVEVSVGSTDKPEIRNGESINFQKTKGLDEIVEELSDKVRPVLVEVRDIIGYINDPDGDLKKTIHNLEQLTRNLDQTRGRADILLVSATQRLETISQHSTTLLDNANRKLDNLAIDRLNTSLEKLPPLLDNLNAVTVSTRKMADQTFPLLPGLLSRTEELLFSTDRLMNTLNNSWLLGGGTAGQQRRQPGVGDSHD